MYHLWLYSIYHEHINISNITSTTSHEIHSTPEFTWKPKWEKTMECFLIYCQEYIHWKHQLPNSLDTTRRSIQPSIYRLQPEGSYNSLNSLDPTPWFSGSNLKEAPTPYVLQKEFSRDSTGRRKMGIHHCWRKDPSISRGLPREVMRWAWGEERSQHGGS